MVFPIHRLFVSALILIMLSACSNSEEPAEKGPIKQTADKIAQEAVTGIKTPLDQANSAKELTEQHNKVIEKNVHQVEK